MNKHYILSIDQGTTGSTVVITDNKLTPVAKGYKEYSQTYPRPGWMEQNPDDIWNSVVSAINQALEKGNISPDNISVIGITNQRETTILWDKKTLKPLAPAIVWQCRRTEEICTNLKNQGFENFYRAKTGLLLDPYFSGTKIRWLLDNYDLQSKAENGEIAFGTVDSFLINRLTGGKEHLTDHTNASRTLLFNIHTRKWDEELLKPLNIPSSVLPEIRNSIGDFGKTSGLDFLPDGIPVGAAAGDQQAALFGQGAFEKGEAKCTYGTGAFLMMNTGSEIFISNQGLLATVAWTSKNEVVYALEGSAFIAGAAVQWLRDGLGLIKTSAEIEDLAKEVSDSGGVYFVPALAGLGAPYWRSEARGIFWGITRGTKRGHIARAVLEGIALQNYEILRLMEETAHIPITTLKADGGASANNILMQFQSDILGKNIFRPANVESTAIGAAAMAALSNGIMKDKNELKKLLEGGKVFSPVLDKNKVNDYITTWQKVVNKA